MVTFDEFLAYLRLPAGAVDVEAAWLILSLTDALVREVAGVVADPAPPRVRAVALEVAARAYRNPEGAVSESIDDYSYSRSASTAAAGVYLTDAERNILREVSGAGRVRSVRLRSPFDVTYVADGLVP